MFSAIFFRFSRLLLLVSAVVAFQQRYPFENCDYYTRLSANEGTSVVNPGGYISIWGFFGFFGYFDPTSSCRYSVECPPNYVIQLYCNLNIAITGEPNSCETERFRVLDDGTNQILDRGRYYCGVGTMSYRSQTNFLSFGHTSTIYSGRYNCTLIAVYRHPFLKRSATV